MAVYKPNLVASALLQGSGRSAVTAPVFSGTGGLLFSITC
jgi:hypothetical protein